MATDWERIHRVLRDVWGYETLRPLQRQVVEQVLSGRDCLVILATGGGKSICFQLPALLSPGLTLVVSPLLALMDDQVRDLKRLGVAAGALHSALSPRDRRALLQQLPHLKLLYLSPETLLSPPVWEKLRDPELAIARLAIDEAHCLVHWGDGFRPAYRRLGTVRAALMRDRFPDRPPPAIAAFTATADPVVQAELVSCLQLRDPAIVRSSPYRENLHLNVAIAWTTAGRHQRVDSFLRQQGNATGLIYARSRRDCEALAARLRDRGYATAAYHAGLPESERQAIAARWLDSSLPFVVCSSAFGMGINKPDCRWVLHYHPPFSLAEYVQEVGRAGRDGQPATALMLASEPTGWLDAGDRRRQQFFLQQQQQQAQQARQALQRLPPQGTLGRGTRDRDLESVLGWLHGAGYLVWRSPFEYELIAPHEQEEATAEDRAVATLVQMSDYISTRSCRWAFLRRAYGDEIPPAWRCDRCDRCQARAGKHGHPFSRK